MKYRKNDTGSKLHRRFMNQPGVSHFIRFLPAGRQAARCSSRRNEVAADRHSCLADDGPTMLGSCEARGEDGLSPRRSGFSRAGGSCNGDHELLRSSRRVSTRGAPSFPVFRGVAGLFFALAPCGKRGDRDRSPRPDNEIFGAW